MNYFEVSIPDTTTTKPKTTTTKITTTRTKPITTTEITIKTTEERTTTTETTKTTTSNPTAKKSTMEINTLPSDLLTLNQKQQMTHTNSPFTTDTEAYLANKKGKPKNTFFLFF